MDSYLKLLMARHQKTKRALRGVLISRCDRQSL